MSTRKSNNKQNADATVSSSQDSAGLRSKLQQIPDGGSESSDTPTTPTSKESAGQLPNSADSKRKRGANSVQSVSTPKRSDASDSTMDDISDRNTPTDMIDDKSMPLLAESPRTRKRGNPGGPRKSNVDSGVSKVVPLRTSLRAANRKNTSPVENAGTPKAGRGRKKADPLSTPIKRERISPIQFETEVEDTPDTKRIKVEQQEEDPEEEILMEIRTEILDDFATKEVGKMLDIKEEKLRSDVTFYMLDPSNEFKGFSSKQTETSPSDDASKADEILIQINPPVIEAVTGAGNSKEGKHKEHQPEKKRPGRKKSIKVTTTPQRGKKGKIEKKDSIPPSKRGRIRKPSIKIAPPKVAAPVKRTRKTIANTKKPLKKSLVPENTNKPITLVPEAVENDDMSNSEPSETIFSTTTDPVNRDTEEQPKDLLVIDTTTQNSDGGKESIPSTECTAGSDKSASLSPVEMESEGVSAVCVKEFYREPQFLENNLGIEKDPTLGGIMQIVERTPSESCTEATEVEISIGPKSENFNFHDKKSERNNIPAPNEHITTPQVLRNCNKSPEQSEGNESDSLKEGELLILEDSTEEENALSQKSEVEQNKTKLVEIIKEENVEDDNENVTVEKTKIPNDSTAIPEFNVLIPEFNVAIPEFKVQIVSYGEIEIKAEQIEENTTAEVKAPQKDIDNKIETNKVVTLDNSNEQNDSLVKLKPEDEAGSSETKERISQDTLLNGTVDDELHEKEETKKDVVKHDVNAMEIDSGVSDVAENNSNDPNEDINLPQVTIENENQKLEMSEGDNAVNAVMQTRGQVNEDILDIKETDLTDSLNTTPNKSDATSMAVKGVPPITIRKVQETAEILKEKENHLKTLGLLTIKAADEAKIEKQKRRQQLNPPSSSNSSCSSKKSIDNNSESIVVGCNPDNSESQNSSGNSSGILNPDNGNKSVQEYTGTLKTVIKINRPSNSNQSLICDKKKTNNTGNGQNLLATNNSLALLPASSSNTAGRHPLKITLQKGRGRCANMERHTNGSQQTNEETYYTIQNENEAAGTPETITHGRKSHHYRSNTDHNTSAETTGADKKEVLIPEKASSFAIHPGRLCQDQCYYCAGKFGLYDTPCHVAQLKSLERQKKILENEEKLTVDNCLCDACFRHLDRRANSAAAQKKRLTAPANMESSSSGQHSSPEMKDSSGNATINIPPGHTLVKSICFVTNCGQRASHTFRRKGFRKTIRKLLGDDIDLTNMGGRLPICDKHYDIIIQCLECALCKRRLIRNHMHHITQDIQLLESLLVKQGIPVKLQANPAVCKLCRYFTNLLLKPPEGKTQKAQFVKNYRRRLLHFHNIQQSDDGSEAEEQNDTEEKSKIQSPAPAKRGRKPKQVQNTVPNQPRRISCTSEDGNSNDIVELGIETAQSALTTSGQMQLDNDVMVDYDVPVICDSPSPPATTTPQEPASKLQLILQGGTVAKTNDDISLALRSNPNISMRELFPGEEEMGLQVNVPFGSSTSHRTPEGWTRVQTFLQYDEPTRRLWEDLQKPYGNQSSFLRHLILLEKYYRNGDLTLSQNASTNAIAYSETVQNRLTSYDHSLPPAKTARNSTIASNTPTKITFESQQQPQTNSNQKASISTFSVSNKVTGNNARQSTMLSVPDPIRKLHNNLTITITPKTKLIPETKQPVSSVSTATSTTTTSTSSNILKSNLLSRKNSAIEIIPIGSGINNDTNTQQTPFLLTKQQKLLAAANQLMGEEKTSSSPITMTSIPPSQLKSLNLPPELISINRNNPGSLLIASRNSLGHSAPMKPKSSYSNHQQMPQHAQHRQTRIPPAIIKLPATLTPQERMSSKHWRPTLMPISSGPVRSAPGVLYQTADGRKLPSLVQVQSGGKPYLISIHDYNRMCILRREKLMRDQIMRNGKVANNTGNSLLKGALSSGTASSSASGSSLLIGSNVNTTPNKSMLHQGKQW